MQQNLMPSRQMERRPPLTLGRGARMGLFALVWLCCALLAVAGTTQRPRPRRPLRVQDAQGPAQAKPKAGSKSGGTSGNRPESSAGKKSPEQSEAAPKRATPRSVPHAKRKPSRPEDDNPEPVTMKRAGHRPGDRALPACRARCTVWAAPRRASATERRAASRAAARVAAQQAAARLAAQRSAEIAANIEASVRAEAQARKSSPVAPVARVEANVPPPAPVVRVPPLPRRVDGFGAEGAELNAPATRAGLGRDATLSHGVTPSRGATLSRGATPVPAAAESDPALQALVHPSRGALAEEAMEPQVLPRIYTEAGRLTVPAPLTGSHDVLVHQNAMADDEGLSRIRNDAELNRLRAQHLLVEFPVSESLRVNPELPANRRCARPWTVRFAAETARAFYARFHEPLVVTSAVRTVSYQLRLQRINGNAAAVEGDGASPHLTGQAIDIGKRGMSTVQLAWMRAFLLPLMAAGKIDVEEEFQQACFHISVYRSYVPAPPRKRTPPRTEMAKNREQGVGVRDSW